MPRISSTSLFKQATSARANLRASIALAVVAIVVLEAALSFTPDRMAAREMRASMQQLGEFGSGSVVIYGDSVAAGGIDERIVADHLGLPHGQVVNLALPGSTILHALPVLSRQLALGQKPDLVVLAYQLPGYASPQPRKFISHFASASDLANLLQLAPPPRDIVAGVIERLSFTVRASGDLRALVLNGDRELLDTWDQTPVGLTGRTAYLENTATRTGDSVVMKRSDLAPALRASWELDPVAAAALRRFLTEAQRAGIGVAFAPPPMRPAVAEACTLPGGSLASAAIAPIVLTAGGSLSVVDELVYPDANYLDPVHLESTGRLRFSRELAAALLPVYRDLPTVRTR